MGTCAVNFPPSLAASAATTSLPPAASPYFGPTGSLAAAVNPSEVFLSQASGKSPAMTKIESPLPEAAPAATAALPVPPPPAPLEPAPTAAPKPLTLEAVRELSPAQLANFKIGDISDLTLAHMKLMTSGQLLALGQRHRMYEKQEGLSDSDKEALKSFRNRPEYRLVVAAISGRELSPQWLTGLTPEQVQAFSALHLELIRPQDLKHLKVEALPKEILATASLEQLRSLAAEQVSRLSKDQIEALSERQFQQLDARAFSDDQITAIGRVTDRRLELGKLEDDIQTRRSPAGSTADFLPDLVKTSLNGQSHPMLLMVLNGSQGSNSAPAEAFRSQNQGREYLGLRQLDAIRENMDSQISEIYNQHRPPLGHVLLYPPEQREKLQMLLDERSKLHTAIKNLRTYLEEKGGVQMQYRPEVEPDGRPNYPASRSLLFVPSGPGDQAEQLPERASHAIHRQAPADDGPKINHATR